MESKVLRERYLARPFVPFDLNLADGRKVQVAHPEVMAIPRKGRTAIVFKQDGSFEYVDIMLVVSLTDAADATAGAGGESSTAGR